MAPLISVDTLNDRLSDPLLRIFDCRFDLADTGRGEREYLAGHIPDAVYAHLDRHLSSPITADTGRHPLPDVANLVAWLRSVGLSQRHEVVVYDDTGGTMAVRLWWLLRWLGHSDVALLDGGWHAWQSAGLAITDHVPAHAPGDFDGEPDTDMVVSAADVETNLDKQDFVLVDARTDVRFRGDAEPIDPVAGHIPGALNLPLQMHLDESGHFLPAHRLRAMYESLLGNTPPDQTACMCGSGVTACHNILAMEIAGMPGTRLYAGSWSEWIRDPAHPVATGDA